MKQVQQKIAKVGLIVLLSLFIYSCGESKTKGWTQQEKDKFVAGCVKSNKGSLSEKKANEICNCMLDKMVATYPTMVESQEMESEDIREMAIECRE